MGRTLPPVFTMIAVLAFAGVLATACREPAYYSSGPETPAKDRQIGDAIDSLNGVAVYYNGPVSNISGRNRAADGYNIGLKYQCVEFVKRYYHDALKHKMPNAGGDAKDFFNQSLSDGAFNADRGLTQYKNGGPNCPRVGDLLVFAPTRSNRFGHVAIVSAVGDDFVEIIQQNPGPGGNTRERLELEKNGQKWKVDSSRLYGWLRKE